MEFFYFSYYIIRGFCETSTGFSAFNLTFFLYTRRESTAQIFLFEFLNLEIFRRVDPIKCLTMQLNLFFFLRSRLEHGFNLLLVITRWSLRLRPNNFGDLLASGSSCRFIEDSNLERPELWSFFDDVVGSAVWYPDSSDSFMTKIIIKITRSPIWHASTHLPEFLNSRKKLYKPDKLLC